MVRKEYDVVICGGGVAGVAAALAAARRGMKTALIEKTILPGGLATSGLVLVYLPLCDGHGTQMIYGISEELLTVSNKYAGGARSRLEDKRKVHDKIFARILCPRTG